MLVGLLSNMVDLVKEFSEWRDLTIGPFTGGLSTDIDSELIEDNQLLVAQNAIFSYDELQSDTGYILKGQSGLRGNPRRVFEYKDLTTNGLITFLVTDLTAYLWNGVALQWQYISNGTETTISSNEAGGQTALSVTSITGFADNDFVGIELDTGAMHFSQVNGAPAGGVITIDDPLPSQASTGRAVIKAVVFTSSESDHVTGVAIPWSGEVVFTNTIDNVKLFSPNPGLHGSIVDLTGTGFPANTKANSVALFDNSVILAGLSEGGTLRLSRFRYCAKGDITAWNTLEAGSTDLLENFGEIIQILPLGAYLIFYRSKGITRVAIGGAGRFTSTPVVSGIGAGVSSNLAAIDLIDRHLVWGTNKFYWYRGGFSIEELHTPIKNSIWGPTGDVKSAFISPQEVFPILLPYRNEVLFSYGAFISGRAYPRYQLDIQRWSKRLFDGGSAKISGFGYNIGSAASGLGRVYLLDATADKVMDYDLSATTDGGANISFEVQTRDFSHPTYLLLHDFSEISCSGSGTLIVDYSVDKGASWINLGNITVTSVPTKTRMFKQFTAQNRTVRFRFTTTSPIVIAFFKMRYKFVSEW